MSLIEETVSVIKGSYGNDRPSLLALPQDVFVPHECVASESNYTGAVLEYQLTFGDGCHESLKEDRDMVVGGSK